MPTATRTRPTIAARSFDRSTEVFGRNPVAVREAAVLDKVAGLTLLAVVAAVPGWFTNSPAALIAALVVAGLTGILGCWVPKTARFLAVPYALAEGFLLGAISRVYQSVGGHIVPLAVTVTAAIYVTTLAAYRSGLVKVNRRFIGMTFAVTVAFLVIVLFGLFVGLPTFGPVAAVIGLLGIFVGVSNLFVDFDYVRRAEDMGLDRSAEWNMALLILVSLVLVYLNVLRFVAAVSGGGRR